MNKRGYKDLHVWRESINFVPDVYRLAGRLPAHEKFALSDQIRRAAISIPANIAEGQASHYKKAFLHHLNIAKGSLAELHTLIIIAEQIGYVSQNELETLESGIQGIARPLHGLISKLQGV